MTRRWRRHIVGRGLWWQISWSRHHSLTTGTHLQGVNKISERWLFWGGSLDIDQSRMFWKYNLCINNRMHLLVSIWLLSHSTSTKQIGINQWLTVAMFVYQFILALMACMFVIRQSCKLESFVESDLFYRYAIVYLKLRRWFLSFRLLRWFGSKAFLLWWRFKNLSDLDKQIVTHY